jgi:hypothetical protein
LVGSNRITILLGTLTYTQSGVTAIFIKVLIRESSCIRVCALVT